MYQYGKQYETGKEAKVLCYKGYRYFGTCYHGNIFRVPYNTKWQKSKLASRPESDLLVTMEVDSGMSGRFKLLMADVAKVEESSAICCWSTSHTYASYESF